MAANDWAPIAQVVSTICAAIGLIFAAFGLMLNASGLSRSRRTADLQALQKFSDDASKREAALTEAPDEQSRIHAFNEFLNFLELYACVYNNGLIGRGGEEIVRHKLEDCFIELDAANAWHSHIAAALDRTTTLVEFTKFIATNREEIGQRKAEKKRFSADH